MSEQAAGCEVGTVSEGGWEFLRVLGERIRTQDNLATTVPIFAVQQRIRDYGSDDNGDGYEWRNADGDWEKASPRKARELDALAEDAEETPGWVRSYYRDRWEFVTACLTRVGCEDYIRLNGHNLCDPRVYVYSGFRNEEWKSLRAALGNSTPTPEQLIPNPTEPRIDAMIAELQSMIRHVNQLDDDESVDDAIARIVRHFSRPTEPREPTEGWRTIDELKGASRVGRRIIALVEGRATVCVWGKASHVPWQGWGEIGQDVEDFDLCEPTHFLVAPPPNDPRIIASTPESAVTTPLPAPPGDQ